MRSVFAFPAGMDGLPPIDVPPRGDLSVTEAQMDWAWALLSVRATSARMLFAGEKTIEWRRRKHDLGLCGRVAAVYETRPAAALIGVVKFGAAAHGEAAHMWRIHGERSGMARRQFRAWLGDAKMVTAITVDKVLARERIPLGEARLLLGPSGGGKRGFQVARSWRLLTEREKTVLEAVWGVPATWGRDDDG